MKIIKHKPSIKTLVYSGEGYPGFLEVCFSRIVSGSARGRRHDQQSHKKNNSLRGSQERTPERETAQEKPLAPRVGKGGQRPVATKGLI